MGSPVSPVCEVARLDREERKFYGTLREELNTLRRLVAVQGDREAFEGAMEEAGDRADSIGREARFLQLDTIADQAERLARSARATKDQDGLGSFLETLFSFQEHLPEGARLSGDSVLSGETPRVEGSSATVVEPLSSRSTKNPAAGDRVIPPGSVEVNFNTPPQELFELDLLERKLVIEALDRGEQIYSVTARGRGSDSGVLLDLLYRLEESMHVIRALTPEAGGRTGRIDVLCASSLGKDATTQVLAESPLQEARIEEVGSERLALSVDRQELRVSRGLLAGLREVQLRLGGDEYERYVLLEGEIDRELQTLLQEDLPPRVSQRLERLRLLTAASAGDIAHRSKWRAVELAYRLALWLEEEGILSTRLRLSVEGGDQEQIESPVAQLAERALRSVVALLLDLSGLTGEREENKKATPELLIEFLGDAEQLTIWLLPVSPALISAESLRDKLGESEAGYVVRDLLAGSVEVSDRRGSEGVSISIPRGGHMITVVIGQTPQGEIAVPASLIVEVQPIFSRLVAQSADGRVFMRFRGSNIPLYDSTGYPVTGDTIPSEGNGVVLRINGRQIALVIEKLISEESVILPVGPQEEVFVESLSRRLPFFFPLELF